MDKETKGTVIAVSKQWWLKVNKKPVRAHALDGATFPHIIKVQYVVDENIYTKKKWISAGTPVPAIGSSLTVLYCSNKPAKQGKSHLTTKFQLMEMENKNMSKGVGV